MINALRKEFCGKCNFVLLYWGWRFCRHGEFFDGWWNNVQAFCWQKEMEGIYGRYEKVFDWRWHEEFFDGWWNNVKVFCWQKEMEEIYGRYEKVFDWWWYHVHVFVGKYEPSWSSILTMPRYSPIS